MSRIVRHSVGQFGVAILADGETEFDNSVFPDVAPDRISELLTAVGEATINTNFNAMLISDGDTRILVDVGAGDAFGPVAGNLPAALEEAGISPESISIVLITHLHADHVGGATTKDGKSAFPNAEFLVPVKEHEYWTDDSNFESTDDIKTASRTLAMAAIQAYGDRVRIVDQTATIQDGITLIDLPGHTPGHVGVQLDSGEDRFVYVTDIFHAQALQFADPTICAAFDMDPPTAIKTRKQTLDLLASEKIAFSGGHVLGATIGILEKRGDGYSLNSL